MNRTFHVDLTRLVVIDLPIDSQRGSTLYRLSCRGGPQELMDRLPEASATNLVGPLICVLNAGNDHISDSSLLAEDDSPMWHTRGQFHAEELTGACGDYPEFGRNRSFRLRGFLLRLEVLSTVWGKEGALDRFTLAVRAENDPTARSAQAEQTGYHDPKSQNCAVIRKSNDPRYCRMANLSWGLCPTK